MSNPADFVIKNGVLEKYQGAGGDVVIPDGVTSIGNRAFAWHSSLTCVTIPGSVTSIGDSAFYNCNSLTSITIPDSVTSIGKAAFSECRSLTSITIPNGVTSIEESVFDDCQSLASITIPDSVTSIGDKAFYVCRSLTSITIPDGVTSIGDRAFYYCYRLTSITIPDSLTTLGNNPFAYCEKLTAINVSIDHSTLATVDGVLFDKTEKKLICYPFAFKNKSYTIPTGTKSIGDWAFSFCKSLTSITIPDSMTYIGDEAFRSCVSLTSITIPAGVSHIGRETFSGCSALANITLRGGNIEIEASAFSGCPSLTVTLDQICDGKTPDFPKGTLFIVPKCLLHQKQPLPLSLAKAFIQTDGEDCAYFAVFQTATAWTDKCRFSNAGSEMMPIICRLLGEVDKLNASKTKFLIELLTEQMGKVDHQVILNTLSVLKKCAVPSAKNSIFSLEKQLKAAQAPVQKQPVELLAEEHLKDRAISDDLLKVANADIPYADGSGNCSRTVLALLLAEYEEQWYRNATEERGGMSTVSILKDGSKVKISKLADEIAASLDRNALLKFLLPLVYGPYYRKYLLAYARFMDEGKAVDFVASIASRKRGHAKERYWAQNAGQALYISETLAAIQYIDRYGDLEKYAAMRNTTADALRFNRLYDFGLDETGEVVFDLGGKNLSVKLNPDLSLRLFDEKAQKVVKSIPKRGTDETLYNTASRSISTLKNNIKQVQKIQFETLFKSFLNGKDRHNSESWKAVYCNNPVLRQIASLLVWIQDGKTFTLRNGQPIDSSEHPFTIGEQPIAVAHPMDMIAADVESWQKYFAVHELRQPFVQVWEPIIDPATIKKDRYKGLMIPFYRFMNQNKHGIHATNDGLISFDECRETVERIDFERHYVDPKNRFEITYFTFKKYTRQVNHIVGLLDKWTIYERILKDDASIIELLPQFTLAQIVDFTKLANENNCPNCTAALLEFKNANYADLDPMAEFLLE